MLFSLMATLQPIYSTVLSSNTTMGIPQQMAQNFADAVGAMTNSSTLIFGAFQSVFAPVSGLAFEASQVSEAISAAFAEGDTDGGFNALVNTPGFLADAFLNGFDYNDANPDANEVGTWARLLSHLVSSPNPNGGRDIVSSASGPLEQFLVTIPGKIAAAIANPTTTTTGGFSLANLFAPAAKSIEAAEPEADVVAVTDATPAVIAEDADEAVDAKPAVNTKAPKHAKVNVSAKKVGENLRKIRENIHNKLKKPTKKSETKTTEAAKESSTTDKPATKESAKKASDKKSDGSDS